MNIRLFSLVYFGLFFNLISPVAIACTGRQECFPETSSQWRIYENEKIIKRLDVKISIDEKFILKKIKNYKHIRLSQPLSLLLKKQFIAASNLASIECETVSFTNGAGSGWPIVWSQECLKSFKTRHISSLRKSLDCFNDRENDVGQCTSILFKVIINEDLKQ